MRARRHTVFTGACWAAGAAGVMAVVAMLAIWAEVLQVRRVGNHDDFFAMGGPLTTTAGPPPLLSCGHLSNF